MQRHLIFSAFIILSSFMGFAQTESPITMNKVMGGYQFYQGQKRLTMPDLMETMKSNNEAYNQIKSAQSANTFSVILGTAGGFLVGYPIGTALGGGEPNWTLAAVGAGLLVVSIPVSQKFKKQASQAVDTYNSGLQTSFWDRHELRFATGNSGIGMQFRF